MRRGPPDVRRLAPIILGLVLSACAGSGAPEVSAEDRLTVFAAGSLIDAFGALAEAFEGRHPGVDVTFSFAGSQQLAQQLGAGAPADVFASADTRQMQVAVAAGVVSPDAIRFFATNRMVVAVPPGNPAGLRTFADLGRPGLLIVLAAPEVPAGHYADMVLDKAAADPAYGPGFTRAVRANVVSYEATVRGVLTKVLLGEADAGVVYQSDVAARGAAGVGVLDIPRAFNVEAAYPIAPLLSSTHAEAATAFIDFVLSVDGRALLAEYGFMQPDPGG